MKKLNHKGRTADRLRAAIKAESKLNLSTSGAIDAIGQAVRRSLSAVIRGPHQCHWPGCGVTIPAALYMCRPHWYALPQPLRDRIWQTYTPGQEVSKCPSAAYLAASRDVQRWVRQQLIVKLAAHKALEARGADRRGREG